MIESGFVSQPSEDKEITGSEAVFENRLRPKSLKDYIGQPLLKANLQLSIRAAKERNEPLDHILLHGAPGLGKTTLANIIASEFGASIRITSGPALEKPADVASILSNLKENDILFIDEIHRLRPVVEEVLYTAMEDFAIDIVIGKGPSARDMRINLSPFTLIGATTKLSMLSSPLRDRFGSVHLLQFYEENDIRDIIVRSGQILNITIPEEAALLLAKTSRQTPRIANRLLKRVRDFAQVHGNNLIDEEIVRKTLHSLGIDNLGLEARDKEILLTLMTKFEGGPVGLSTLAAAISEEQSTLEDIYEPFLIQLGFLKRTPRGRMVTPKAYSHLGRII